MNLDEESRKIIREKLNEANDKIKNALEERQKNLDAKLAGGAAAAAPKKK
jgi:TRAP-type C4-dicarboxylate transport system substrate-binding protein